MSNIARRAGAPETIADAERRDAADPLRKHSNAFVRPQGVIYLDGNSLGCAPKRALDAVDATARGAWADGLIRSWNDAGWWDLPLTVGDKIGRLIGAAPGQTVAADTTSLNIFKVLHAALAMRPGRRVLLLEKTSFPTDIYIAEGIARSMPGVTVRLIDDGARALTAGLQPDVAIYLANQVDYRTGELRDVAAVTAETQAAGALIAWDLCHSAGAMAVDLDAVKADFAVGCGYKYLNGGPGAPAFVYAASRHHDAVSHPLTGWFSHAAPFAFEPSYRPVSGMRRFLIGTQPILSLTALDAAVDLWHDIDIAAVRAKSVGLTRYFIELVETSCAAHGLRLVSPREDIQRGSQVSFAHADGYPIMQALIAAGVIGDFRAPNLIRFGFAPLYISYRDVHDAVAILSGILETGRWREARYAVRAAVT